MNSNAKTPDYTFGELNVPPSRQPRQARSSMPWWNPRYWGKRAFITIGIIAVIVLVIIIIVAVMVTKAAKKNNAYPNYTNVTYALSDTSKLLSISMHSIFLMLPLVQGQNFFDSFNYRTGYDPGTSCTLYARST